MNTQQACVIDNGNFSFADYLWLTHEINLNRRSEIKFLSVGPLFELSSCKANKFDFCILVVSGGAFEAEINTKIANSFNTNLQLIKTLNKPIYLAYKSSNGRWGVYKLDTNLLNINSTHIKGIRGNLMREYNYTYAKTSKYPSPPNPENSRLNTVLKEEEKLPLILLMLL